MGQQISQGKSGTLRKEVDVATEQNGCGSVGSRNVEAENLHSADSQGLAATIDSDMNGETNQSMDNYAATKSTSRRLFPSTPNKTSNQKCKELSLSATSRPTPWYKLRKRKRRFWSLKEEEQLYLAVKKRKKMKYGVWADIARETRFRAWTNVQLKDKYRSMVETRRVKELDKEFMDYSDNEGDVSDDGGDDNND